MTSLKIDSNSRTWLEVKQYVDRRILELRSRIESDLTEKETIQHRARLAELRSFLSSTEFDEPVIEQAFDLPN